MSVEGEGPIYGPELPKKRVDPYAATRELERWLNRGMSMDSIPRPDQRGTSDTYERLPTSPSLPANWEDNAEVVFSIIEVPIFDKDGNEIGFEIEYVRPNTSPINEVSTED